MDWQAQLAFAPQHAGGLSIPFLPTTAPAMPLCGNSSNPMMRVLLPPFILQHLATQHAFQLTRHIPDIR
eukprot:4826803-Amphidinium_carterae.1